MSLVNSICAFLFGDVRALDGSVIAVALRSLRERFPRTWDYSWCAIHLLMRWTYFTVFLVLGCLGCWTQSAQFTEWGYRFWPTATVLVGSFTIFHILFKSTERYLWSEVLEQSWINITRTEAALDYGTTRQLFQSAPFYRGKHTGIHSHGKSAQDRNAATRYAVSFAETLGHRAHFIQASRSNQRRGYKGSRKHYWMKDLNAAGSYATAKPGDIRVIIDTDEYIDVPAMLAEQFIPTLIYTVAPKSAGYSGSEYSFWFDAENKLHYRVNGGAEYVHEVWNYATDTVSVGRWTTAGCYFFLYNVDRKMTSDHHELVLLTPTAHFWLPIDQNCLCSLLPRFIARFQPVQTVEVDQSTVTIDKRCVQLPKGRRDFVAFERYTPNGCIVSIGHVNSTHCANIPQVTHHALLAAARHHAPKRLTTAKIEASTGIKDFGPKSALVEYYGVIGLEPTERTDTGLGDAQHYTYHPSDDDMISFNKSVVPYMAPLYHGATAPGDTPGNGKRSLDSRVLGLQGNNRELTPWVSRILNELVDYLAGKMLNGETCLTPLSIAEVADRQKRATQKSVFAQGEDDGLEPRRPAEAFMKKESYSHTETEMEWKDPRNITIFTGSDKVGWGRYMYPFMDRLKNFSWYAFGKTPKQISEDVAESCNGAINVGMTDLSRQDGRTCILMRLLEHRLLLRLFDSSEHNELLDGHNRGFQRDVVTKWGEWYRIEFDRGSGNLETGPFNVIEDLAVHYLNLRNQRFSPSEAVKWLETYGHFGGDDGLLANMPGTAEQFLRAANTLGHKGKIEFVEHGGPGVEFLARTWSPLVWQGCPDNIATPRRQIVKVHLTADKTSKPLTKLLQKAMAYRYTDFNTPILGEWAKAVINWAKQCEYELPDQIGRHVSWFARKIAKGKPGFPNDNVDEWASDLVESQCPDFDHRLFLEWLAFPPNAPLEYWLQGPTFGGTIHEPKPPKEKEELIAVDVGGDIVLTSAPPAPNTHGTTYYDFCDIYQKDGLCNKTNCGLKHEKRPQYCRDFIKGSCTRKKCRFVHERVLCRRFRSCNQENCWKYHDRAKEQATMEELSESMTSSTESASSYSSSDSP